MLEGPAGTQQAEEVTNAAAGQPRLFHRRQVTAAQQPGPALHGAVPLGALAGPPSRGPAVLAGNQGNPPCAMSPQDS